MEVRDSLLLPRGGILRGAWFAVIVGVYRGAVVYMVPLWYHSILRKKCETGVKMYVGCWQCAKGLWECAMVLTCGCTLSTYRCMRGCIVAPTVVCMGQLCSLSMLVLWQVGPLSFLDSRVFLFGVLFVKALYVCDVMSSTYLCTWWSTNCKVPSWFITSFWALCDQRWYYNK